jgi:hypothetical protein
MKLESFNKYSNCDYLYHNIKDPIFHSFKDSYSFSKFTYDLVKLCNSYPSMEVKNFMSLIESVNYSNMKLLKMYNQQFKNYDQVSVINDLDEFYDQFTIVVLIIRPIQTFLYDTIISNSIEQARNSFLICIFIYLVLNILVEIAIFLLIDGIFIQKVLLIENEIKSFIMTLK